MRGLQGEAVYPGVYRYVYRGVRLLHIRYGRTLTLVIPEALASTDIVPVYAMYTLAAETVKEHGSKNLIITVPLVVYGMYRYQYLVLQRGKGGDPKLARDINLREWASLLPPALLVILFGFYPAPILKIMNPVLEAIITRLPVDKSIDIAALITGSLHGLIN